MYWSRFFTGHAVGLAAGDGGDDGDGAGRCQGGGGPVSLACFLGMARLLRCRGGGPAGGCGFKDMARLERIVVIQSACEASNTWSLQSHAYRNYQYHVKDIARSILEHLSRRSFRD